MDKPSTRLESLDALRGFDMLFIMGFAGFVAGICALFPASGFAAALGQSMGHVEWNGLWHHDTIFPLFLFIAGVTFPFSYSKQISTGRTRTQIYLHVLRRVVLLVLLGFVYNGFFKFNFDTFRCASVLARIGIAWGIAAVIYMNCGRYTRIVIAVAILLGYWLLSAYVGAPDAPAGAGPLTKDGCLAGYIDRCWLPGTLIYDNFDPEGLLSTVPAVVTAMLGIFAGEFIRLPEERISGTRKALYLLGAAVAFAVVAYAWNFVLPVNKKLWSSSFVCAVAAYSFGMLALFYYLIDVRGWRRWTLFFRVIGLNSITIYLAQRFIDFKKVSTFFLGGTASLFDPEIGDIIIGGGYIAACWLMLYFLYRKKTFLKV